MIFVSEKSLSKNFRKHGFTTYDKEAILTFNNYLHRFVVNSLNKAFRKNKNVPTLQASHLQAGGRIVLPSEYFGVPSGSYYENLSYNGMNMNTTQTMIRPTIPASDLSGAIKGGGVDFTVPMSALKSAVQEAKVSLNQDAKVSSGAMLELKNKFENLACALLKDSKSSTGHLEVKMLEEKANKKKYNMFR